MRQQSSRDKCWKDFDVPLLVKNPQGLKEFVGKEIGVTEWFEVTQERIDQVAHATEDQQWIHVDEARNSSTMVSEKKCAERARQGVRKIQNFDPG